LNDVILGKRPAILPEKGEKTEADFQCSVYSNG